MQNLLTSIYGDISTKKYANIPENLSKIKHLTLISAWACKFEVGDCKDRAIALFKEWMQKNNPELENP